MNQDQYNILLCYRGQSPLLPSPSTSLTKLTIYTLDTQTMKSAGAAEEEKNTKKGNSFSKFSSKVKDKLASLGEKYNITGGSTDNP